MKVLGIGESVIDMTYVFENGIPADLIPDTKSEKHVGGPVLSAMILLSRLGVDCTFVSTIGRDDNAIIIKKLLKHESIQLIPKYQRRTKVNKILVDARNGSRKKVRGNITHPDIKHLDRKLSSNLISLFLTGMNVLHFMKSSIKSEKIQKLLLIHQLRYHNSP
jgi:sugar/nucleoside kinase (ribokinase family)